MKYLAFIFLAALGVNANECSVELQYQGRQLGQNTFVRPSCEEAIKQCEKAMEFYSTANNLSELSCTIVSNPNQNPTPYPGEPLPPGGGFDPNRPIDLPTPGPGFPGGGRNPGFPGGPGIPGGPGPIIPTKPLEIYGDCHLDDDANFNPNENVLPLIFGKSAKEIIEKCDEEKTRTGNVSSRVLNFQIAGQAEPQKYSAYCHLDDDRSFDSDLYSAPIFADTIMDLVQECEDLEEMVFPGEGSSKIKDLQAPLSPLGRAFECHIDDDPSFDFNILVFAPMFAYDIIEASRECERIQKFYYPQIGSFRVR